VVPTYNERENVGPLIERLHRSLAGLDYEVLVVDDGSPDGTAEAALECGRRLGAPVRVLVRPGRLGLSSAVLDGARAARGEVVCVMDADLQHPPELIPSMLEALRSTGADIVVASRYVEGGGVEGWSPLRRLMSLAATLLARLLVPRARGVRDPMSGFFMFRRRVVEGVELRPRGFKVLLELLARGRWSRAVEVPYVFRPRERGCSKMGARTIAEYLAQLSALAYRR